MYFNKDKCIFHIFSLQQNIIPIYAPEQINPYILSFFGNKASD